ncbi:MAG: nucleotidyltransferase domain-containing protein [Trichlorobacter sp.]|uniref:nucleotidyltransferase domain-containing protein n=1 Tax=Trichlorobacter sp. TaxID=2911007 RepID=UPI00256C6A47|nr:nucleotidyltransferase domain-containing protein [Trichlorobacter sp.]MDK9718791.1 nucleotidyltransferase domain-containing protein [Trichlorobacter sp.]
MQYGLREETIEKVCGVLSQHPSVEKAVLYGSRVKGTFKPGSDIDLSLHGAAITLNELGDIDSELDDLLLPYTFDLLIFDTLNHADLREHIVRVGKIFYEQGKARMKDELR